MKKFVTVLDLPTVVDGPADDEFDGGGREDGGSFSATQCDLYSCLFMVLAVLCLLGFSWLVTLFIFLWI